MKRWKNLVVAAAALVVLCSSASELMAAKKYFRATYPLPPGVTATRSSLFGLNEAGNHLGYYEDTEGQKRYFFHNTANDSYIVFPPNLRAGDLADNGVIVGWDTESSTALYWNRLTGDLVELPPLPGDLYASARLVNNAGVVAGYSDDIEERKAVAWKVDNLTGEISGPVELPYFPEHLTAEPDALTEEDSDGVTLIVGVSWDWQLGLKAAVTWEVVAVDGVLALLSGPDDLGCLPGGETYAFATDVSEQGDIVGRSNDDAFYKPAGGTMQALKKIKIKRVLAEQAEARGMNDNGIIVGWNWRWKGGDRAVVWTSPNKPYDLNSLVDLGRPGRLWSAHDVNNSNMILSSLQGNSYFGVLLIPNQ